MPRGEGAPKIEEFPDIMPATDEEQKFYKDLPAKEVDSILGRALVLEREKSIDSDQALGEAVREYKRLHEDE